MYQIDNGSRARTGGLKTDTGKLASARNAVKHGLSSSQPIVLDFETPEAWSAFQTAFVESLHPANAAERCLAEQIALTMWRQRRIPLYEARLLNTRLQSAEGTWEQFAHNRTNPTEEELQVSLQVKLTEALLRNQETDRLIRYEAHLDRKLTRLFREFHLLQKLRNELTCQASSEVRDASSEPEAGSPLPVTSDHSPALGLIGPVSGLDQPETQNSKLDSAKRTHPRAPTPCPLTRGDRGGLTHPSATLDTPPAKRTRLPNPPVPIQNRKSPFPLPDGHATGSATQLTSRDSIRKASPTPHTETPI
jgi:hypothetical protein